jgi:hypothetical protein
LDRDIDTADHKKSDFIVKYLGGYESIFDKALTRGSRVLKELFDEKSRVGYLGAWKRKSLCRKCTAVSLV